MNKKVTKLFSALLVSSVILSACGNTKQSTSNNEKEKNKNSTELATKQVLNISEGSEIPTMDTTKATDAVSFNVMNNVYEGLYRLGKDDKLEPGIAEKYDKSEDGKTYTFHLRKNAKWSNGDP